jgi:ketosteroid isomerase-like protein
MNSSVRTLSAISALLMIFSYASSQTQSRESQTVSTLNSDSIIFTNLVNQYAKSIDDADTLLASKLWSDTPDISFINPMGEKYGWKGIRNIYIVFRDNFTERKLRCSNLKFTSYGNVELMSFYWVFDATMKIKNGTQRVQTKGRESQVWIKTDKGWRLVHVHYSEMPDNSQGEGF